MINDPLSQDFPQQDFLERGRNGMPTPKFPELAENNKLLRQVLLELRKSHPSIRCTIDVQYSNPAGLLVTNQDRADVRFLYNGKPVKAQYVIIGQSINRGLNVAINEPSVIEPTGTRGNGIWMLANVSNPQFIELNAEIEWISVGMISNTVGNTVSVGKAPPTGITAGATGGLIPVYAWTIPQADMMELE